MTIRRSPTLLLSGLMRAATLLLSVQPAHSFAASEIHLICKGNISTTTAAGSQLVEDQEIAVHIHGDRISFSGNHLLNGKDIQVCTPAEDEPYFDSQTCGKTVNLNERRDYGTYNKITGAIQLTNEVPLPAYLRAEGSFKCRRVDPVMK